ncbi:unnamed protein product [Ilex paraguariensis]|uniref:PIR2-like helical domain-containing protein n=1 Tax=Ilex paraguariensis TaxID=185542 RepID=A0ABC8RJF5_9AQUA
MRVCLLEFLISPFLFSFNIDLFVGGSGKGNDMRTKGKGKAKPKRSVKTSDKAEFSNSVADVSQNPSNDSGGLEEPEIMNLPPNQNVNVNMGGWGGYTEVQMEKLLHAKLEVIYLEAFQNLLNFGYPEAVAKRAILISGHWFGNMNIMTNIVTNCVAFIDTGKLIDSRLALKGNKGFHDLHELVLYSLRVMVNLVQITQPNMQKSEAMQHLLAIDFHGCPIRAIFPPYSLNENQINSTISIDGSSGDLKSTKEQECGGPDSSYSEENVKSEKNVEAPSQIDSAISVDGSSGDLKSTKEQECGGPVSSYGEKKAKSKKKLGVPSQINSTISFDGSSGDLKSTKEQNCGSPDSSYGEKNVKSEKNVEAPSQIDSTISVDGSSGDLKSTKEQECGGPISSYGEKKAKSKKKLGAPSQINSTISFDGSSGDLKSTKEQECGGPDSSYGEKNVKSEKNVGAPSQINSTISADGSSGDLKSTKKQECGGPVSSYVEKKAKSKKKLGAPSQINSTISFDGSSGDLKSTKEQECGGPDSSYGEKNVKSEKNVGAPSQINSTISVDGSSGDLKSTKEQECGGPDSSFGEKNVKSEKNVGAPSQINSTISADGSSGDLKSTKKQECGGPVSSYVEKKAKSKKKLGAPSQINSTISFDGSSGDLKSTKEQECGGPDSSYGEKNVKSEKNVGAPSQINSTISADGSSVDLKSTKKQECGGPVSSYVDKKAKSKKASSQINSTISFDGSSGDLKSTKEQECGGPDSSYGEKNAKSEENFFPPLPREVGLLKRVDLIPTLTSHVRQKVAQSVAACHAELAALRLKRQASAKSSFSNDLSEEPDLEEDDLPDLEEGDLLQPVVGSDETKELLESNPADPKSAMISNLPVVGSDETEELLESNPADLKSAMISNLVKPINELEKQVEEEKEWAQEKVIHAPITCMQPSAGKDKKTKRKAKPKRSVKTSEKAESSSPVADTSQNPSNDSDGLAECENMYSPPHQNVNVNMSGWDGYTEDQLEKLLYVKLEAIYLEAFQNLLNIGYADGVAKRAILMSGHWFGPMNILTNIVTNCIAFIDTGRLIDSRLALKNNKGFMDLFELLMYSLRVMVNLVQIIEPNFQKSEAMRHLLATDFHACPARAIFPPSSRNENQINSTFSADWSSGDLKSAKEQECGGPDSSYGEKNAKSEKNVGAPSQINSTISVDESSGDLKSTKEQECGGLDSSDGEKNAKSEKNLGALSQINNTISVVGSSGDLKSTKEQQFGSPDSSYGEKNAKSEKNFFPPLQKEVGLLRRVDLIPMLTSHVRQKAAQSVVTLRLKRQVSAKPSPSNDLSEELDLEEDDLPDLKEGDLLQHVVGSDEMEELLESNSDDPKSVMISNLVKQIKELEKQVEEEKEWAQKKVAQAEKKVSQDLAELRMLRMEKAKREQLKIDNQLFEEESIKQILEMEKAIRKANCDADLANEAVMKLETVNAEIRADIKALNLSASESDKASLVVLKREKKIIKKLAALDREKCQLQEQIKEEKQKQVEMRQELLRIEKAQEEAKGQHAYNLQAQRTL